MSTESHRASSPEIDRQSVAVTAMPLLNMVMETLPDGMVVLNRHRQIVCANRAFRELAGGQQVVNLMGLRPGEAVGCILSDLGTDGCGTSDKCLHCGVLVGALNSLSGIPDAQESHIRLKSGRALDVEVWTTPFCHEDETFTLCCFVNKLATRRDRVLERLFFHDLLSQPGGLKGLVETMVERVPTERADAVDFATRVVNLSAVVMEEVEGLQDVEAAEKGTLKVCLDDITSLQMLQEIAEMHRHHRAARDRELAVDPATPDLPFRSDRRLLRRILGQMVKNALEASADGECVTLRCLDLGDQLGFEVHNAAFMLKKDQERLFQRVPTPCGTERGLGTYSVKLFAERCLGGQVSFTTHRRNGTTFRVRLPRH